MILTFLTIFYGFYQKIEDLQSIANQSVLIKKKNLNFSKRCYLSYRSEKVFMHQPQVTKSCCNRTKTKLGSDFY